MKPKIKSEVEEIRVDAVSRGEITFSILGTTPLILNRMSQKAQRELLMPKGKKTTAEKQSTLKHDPLAEYRASAHLNPDDKAPTRLMIPFGAFKGALRSVALDIPGAAKAQIGRLTTVVGEYQNIWGVPQMFISIVRNSDANHTPDPRTRLIVPQWAAMVKVTYIKPILREASVVNLMAAAGVMRGVGDYRPEKGAGSFGQFECVSAYDPRFVRVLKEGGLAAQDRAIDTPGFYDAETAELYSWFETESKKRGFKVA